jgi:hypothetical protein
MEQEKCYDKAEDMNDEASYYSIVICKED